MQSSAVRSIISPAAMTCPLQLSGAGTYVSAQGTPYTDEQCRRILSERVDSLLIEGRNLGYGVDKLTALLRERNQALRQIGQPAKEV